MISANIRRCCLGAAFELRYPNFIIYPKSVSDYFAEDYIDARESCLACNTDFVIQSMREVLAQGKVADGPLVGNRCDGRMVMLSN